MITYESTRGCSKNLSFRDITIGSIADDGGLYVPSSFPDLTTRLGAIRMMTFQETAFEIMKPFVECSVPDTELKTLIDTSFSSFRHREITPLVTLSNGLKILELFHGPTFAFKDIALQFLGNLFQYFTKEKMTVLAATSGDTGSAAIHGLRGKKNIRCFVLYPDGMVSDAQRMQMTTSDDPNVHVAAVRGTFDDAQNIVKQCFADKEFKKTHNLTAVNSINFARILAQITYYFYAWARCDVKGSVSFSVPTGNFGDVLAGYYAKMMGLPIDKLVVATNENDILYRFFETGAYEKGSVVMTISPSMDIQVSSNFERLLFDLSGRNAPLLSEWMKNFNETGKLIVPKDAVERAREIMRAYRCGKDETINTMRETFLFSGYILDPHSAVAVRAGQMTRGKTTMVCLATAHPGKFADTVQEAVGNTSFIPPEISSLTGLVEKYVVLSADTKTVMKYINA